MGFYDSDDLTPASIAYYSRCRSFRFFSSPFHCSDTSCRLDNRNAVLSFVLQYFPTQFSFIAEQLDSFSASHLTVGVAGTLALVWGAVGVFGAMSAAINYAWGVGDPRGFWKHKLFAFAMFGVAALLLLVALFLVSASQMVGARWFAGILADFRPQYPAQPCRSRRHDTAVHVIVGFVFYFVPTAKVRLRDVWIGAVITGLLWKGAFVAFTWHGRHDEARAGERLDSRGRRLPRVGACRRSSCSTVPSSRSPTRGCSGRRRLRRHRDSARTIASLNTSTRRAFWR